MDAIGNFIQWLLTSPLYCIFWIVIGFIAGALARRIMKSPNASFIGDVILGIIGALVGGFILGLLGFRQSLDIGFGIGSLVTALIGAIIIIFLQRTLMGRR